MAAKQTEARHPQADGLDLRSDDAILALLVEGQAEAGVRLGRHGRSLPGAGRRRGQGRSAAGNERNECAATRYVYIRIGSSAPDARSVGMPVAR